MNRIQKALLIGTLGAIALPGGTALGVSQDLIMSHTPPATAIVTARATVAQARAYALSRVGRYQFSCLNKLWYKESHWNPFERYGSAYGIPQAVPGSKMASFGSDWRYNPMTQVRWGLSYISRRYGTPCHAWSHSIRYNWY